MFALLQIGSIVAYKLPEEQDYRGSIRVIDAMIHCYMNLLQ